MKTKEKTEIADIKGLPESNVQLRGNLAIGTITLFFCIVLLVLVNSLVYFGYHPDTNSIIDRVVPLSIAPREWFAPEPVERLQYLLSMFLTPFIIFGVFSYVNKKRDFFYANSKLSSSINVAGLLILIAYIAFIMTEKLVHIPDETNAFFFKNNLLSIFSPLIAIPFYLLIIWGYYFYVNTRETNLMKLTTSILTYGLVSFVIFDLILYNVFQVAKIDISITGETNAVFYSITQVYAGKSLLVNINCQYGLYAWMLLPVFKIIGLSSYKMGMVMGILNAISYFLLFLGIKRILKHDVLALVTFLAVVFWQYWQARIPFGADPRFYYQYWPLRILFPFATFFLITLYGDAQGKKRRWLLPLLAFTSSFAILWNSDTGIVVFGAVAIALIAAEAGTSTARASITKVGTWMLGSLSAVLFLFSLSTKIHSGSWPDFVKIFDYQSIFYGSGFFMLPMTAAHFWNLPVLTYVIAGIYCVYKIKTNDRTQLPLLIFLFVLGIGVFAYFQGRSYDLSINAVIYPAIIILGILCYELLKGIKSASPGFRERILIILLPLIFLVDSAISMIYYIPSVHSFSWNNAFTTDKEKEDKLALRLNFIKNNIPEKDTVLILAKNFECYYYASGKYYNPLNLPGSTEIFFRSELDTLLQLISTTKYPIIMDARYYWSTMDTIVATMSKHTTIQKELAEDYAFVLLKPGKYPETPKLVPDASTLYYSNLGAFSKFLNPSIQVTLPENFAIEFFASLDSSLLTRDNIMFCTITQNNPFSGVLMKQDGNDLTHYVFMYGDGSKWCKAEPCILHCSEKKHILIKVQKNIITTWDDSNLSTTTNTNSVIRNNNGLFYINPVFAGTVAEIKVFKL